MAFNGVSINGTMYSWGQVLITFLGAQRNLITRIDFQRVGNHTAEYATGQEVIGYSYGEYTYTCSIEMYIEEWRLIEEATNFSPTTQPPFDITIQFLGSLGIALDSGFENGPVLPYKYKIYDAVFLEDGFSTGKGDSGVTVTRNLLIRGFQRIL